MSYDGDSKLPSTKGGSSAGTSGNASATLQDRKKKVVSQHGAGKASAKSGTSSFREPPRKRRKKTREEDPNYPVQPNIIQIVKKPRTYVDHTYRDFSNVYDDSNFKMPEKIDEMNFLQKLYHLLSEENDFAKQAISWCAHGRAFKVHNPAFLENSGLLTSYFGHNRYTKFVRQLTNHDFKRLTEGSDEGCFYSEFLLRGLPHLLKYAPAPCEKRRLLPDPENEPDFYKVSRIFPLPGDRKDPREEARAALAAKGIVISDSLGASTDSAPTASVASATASIAHPAPTTQVHMPHNLNGQSPLTGLSILQGQDHPQGLGGFNFQPNSLYNPQLDPGLNSQLNQALLAAMGLFLPQAPQFQPLEHQLQMHPQPLLQEQQQGQQHPGTQPQQRQPRAGSFFPASPFQPPQNGKDE